jgi:hypothetical protein
MFAREIIYTPYFYLQKRNHVGSINEFSWKTRLSLITFLGLIQYGI